MRKLLFVVPVMVVVILGSFILSDKPDDANAYMTGFDPGNIMSDYVMSDKGSMTEAQIQSFLKSKNPCNDTGIARAALYPNVKYNIKDGHFVCMADDIFDGETAARIIWRASQDYNINPQVIIALLEKEQGLITDTWPNNVQYRTATGYGCPDTAPCDAQYYGLKNQIRKAAALFREVLDGGWTNYPVGNTYVRYNPDTACGGSVVNIQNRATSALYRYTPYQPNAGAIANNPGTAPCGAYGNRNFYNYFTNWFGSTHGVGFVSLTTPRFMQTTHAIQKVDLTTNKRVASQQLTANQIIYFTTKTTINGQSYLRTERDTQRNNNYGIPLEELAEITIKFESMSTPRYMISDKAQCKVDPSTLKDVQCGTIAANQQIYFSTKIDLAGTTYLRTRNDTNNSRSMMVPLSSLSELSFDPMSKPRTMVTNTGYVYKYNPITEQKTSAWFVKNTELAFSDKVVINGEQYLRTKADSSFGTILAIGYSELDELPAGKAPLVFEKMSKPRYMTVLRDTYNHNPNFTKSSGSSVKKGTRYYFDTKVIVNGKTYVRTKDDTTKEYSRAILLDDLKDS